MCWSRRAVAKGLGERSNNGVTDHTIGQDLAIGHGAAANKDLQHRFREAAQRWSDQARVCPVTDPRPLSMEIDRRGLGSVHPRRWIITDELAEPADQRRPDDPVTQLLCAGYGVWRTAGHADQVKSRQF